MVRPNSADSLPYRAQLDGLRAVAVYLVVAFHAGLRGFDGGFIGVDVFFVLSGFLVTSILLHDLVSAGRIAHQRFYARRARRILPAALVTLVVSAVAYAAVATPAEMLDVLGGFRASCLYVANWFFIRQSTDYFAANVDTSPVLHFWSLAVEEQFYLLWPLLLGGLFLATRRVRRWRWWVLRALVGAAAAASAIAAWRIADTNLERAYYGTDTRAYQLLAGALLALTPQLFRMGAHTRRFARWAPELTVAGLLVVASSVLRVSPITRGFLAAALASTLIVVSEGAGGGIVNRALSSRPFTYLGQLSYGTYLWHWPVVVIVGRGRHIGSLPLFVIACTVATTLAACSFSLVEHPLRRSRALDRYRRPVIAVGISISLVAGLLVMPAVLDSHHTTVAASGSEHLLDWRAAKNDIAKLPDCLNEPVERCTVVRGSKQRVLLIGDSHAQMWLPAFESIARAESLSLSVAVLDACPWQRGLFYLDSGDLYRNCKRHQADWYERVVPEFNPDVVVLAQAGPGGSRFPLPFTFPDGRKLAFGAPGYDDAFMRASAATLETLQAPHRRIVILEPIPATFPFDPISCLSRGGPVAACARKVDAPPTAVELYYRQLHRRSPIWSLDLDRVVCPRLPICDPIVRNVIVRRDANGHLTATFARSVAASIEKMLRVRAIL